MGVQTNVSKNYSSSKEPESRSVSGDVKLGLADLLASESKEALSEYFDEVKRLCPEKATVNSKLRKL